MVPISAAIMGVAPTTAVAPFRSQRRWAYGPITATRPALISVAIAVVAAVAGVVVVASGVADVVSAVVVQAVSPIPVLGPVAVAMPAVEDSVVVIMAVFSAIETAGSVDTAAVVLTSADLQAAAVRISVDMPLVAVLTWEPVAVAAEVAALDTVDSPVAPAADQLVLVVVVVV